jgi:ATP-dependent Clp protease ATP-binding subunit ClpA
VSQTVSILRGLRMRYEKHHSVRISDKALVAAATLSDRYIPDRFLPDKVPVVVLKCRMHYTVHDANKLLEWR